MLELYTEIEELKSRSIQKAVYCEYRSTLVTFDNDNFIRVYHLDSE